MSVKRLSVFTLALLPLASGAWAADATPEGAQALERAVREWATGLLGPSVKIANRPVQIAPEGDHYTVAVPLGEAFDSPRLTATARALDAGRWSIDNIRLPSPTEFKVDLPQATGDKDPSNSVVVSPVTYKITVGQQTGQIVFDPAFAAPSTLNASFQNMDVSATGDNMQTSSHLDRSATTSILRPASNGRVDLLTDSTLEGYRIAAKTPDNEALEIGMGRVRVTGEVSGVSRDRSVQILQALIEVGAMMQTAPKGTASPTMDDKSVQILLEAFADLASGMSLDETIERLSVSYGGMSGTLNALRFGFAAKSDAGVLNARMDLGAEGLALPDLGLGDMVQLIPSKVALRPTVSGIATADLVRLAKASQNGGSPSPADVQALFSRGGIAAGLESFSIDVAGAAFAGMGKLVFTSPDAFNGTAQITATNLDLLQQRVAANPQFAQALPVFIFAKGIGRTVNNRMVWDVSYQNGRLMVNNQDLSAMAGGAPPEPQKAPARPQQRQQNQRR